VVARRAVLTVACLLVVGSIFGAVRSVLAVRPVARPVAIPVAGATTVLPTPMATPAGPPPAPMARSRAAVAYDGSDDMLVLFGGVAPDGHGLTDTWTFDGQRWTQRGVTTSPPAGGANQMTFDGAIGKVLLFAGAGQTWTWDGERWNQEHPVHQPPRAGTLTYDPSLGVVVLLTAGAEMGTHTWGWNGGDWYPISESVPDPGRLAGLAYDVRGARLLGLGDGTWAYIGNRWSRVGDLPQGPGLDVTSIATSTALNEPVVFAGGLWAWDGKSWQAKDAPGGPAARQGAVLADDEKRQQLVLFGGVDTSGVLGDTWTWSPDKGWNRVG
jgi:hypothetical protein